MSGISEISIKDNGIGIAKKQLNKKFKPFYELEKAEQTYERTRITGIHGKNGVGRLTFFVLHNMQNGIQSIKKMKNLRTIL